MVPGERAIIELLRADPRRIEALYLLEGRSAPPVEELAAAVGVAIQRVHEERLATFVAPALARGMVAVAAPPASGPSRSSSTFRSGRARDRCWWPRTAFRTPTTSARSSAAPSSSGPPGRSGPAIARSA
ncbi:MAG: hypothetical protein H6710_21425 [Myxococcales bacterium]|nr:hypothetical protein [Myxococcales bacterium]